MNVGVNESGLTGSISLTPTPLRLAYRHHSIQSAPVRSDLTCDVERNGMRLPSFAFPTATIFGAGALSELPKHLQRLSISRPLVVTDRGLLNTSGFRALRATLGETLEGQQWFLFADVH